MQKFTFALFAIFCFGFASLTRGQEPRAIILFTAENLGPGDLDQDRILLPNLKMLINESARYNSFYSSSARRNVAFHSMYTGQDSGISNIRSEYKTLPTPQEATPFLASELTKLGYLTTFIGTWPYEGDENYSPEKLGFQLFYGQINDDKKQSLRFPKSLNFANELIELNNPDIPRHFTFIPGTDIDKPISYNQFRGTSYAPQILHQATLKFIDQQINDKSKFFLHYAHSGLEPGLNAKQEDYADFLGRIPDIPYSGQKGFSPLYAPRANQLALLQELDRHLGDIIDKLKSNEIFKDTLFIFTSPNTASDAGGRDLEFFNSLGDKRGMRGDYYEAGLLVPFLAHWPKILKAGNINQDLSSQTSIFTSILSVAKNESKPLFLPKTELYWEDQAYLAIRKGSYKLIQKQSLLTPASIQLFDLSSDPKEEKNLAEEKASEVKSLLEAAAARHIAHPSAPSLFDPKVEAPPTE
ncbi:sulfatase-like hydrolase/transferase [Lentisphaera profundi]|uniref:Sulfatase-like hydrolase/transferase n=1 Tax=Lentisphaera profundi TaxID=1658616 RepID=A0ABY7VSN2_9BACT|nr:sulfatase-like hydrolase/transferase [Lentisphaera profundi]WDE96754.1 sulfatase-like hydrolase/transferase [Lentisphaera profundi]